jgi:predicted nuclease of predicted toxin-antitoxin system
VKGRGNKLRLFLDEGVPDAVGRQFVAFGHEVIYLRDCIATGSPDDLVCVAAEANEAILVACDGDMRQMVKRFGIGNGRFKKLSLIKLSCPEPQAANRLKEAMTLIEHEWRVSQAKTARRLYIEVSPAVIKTMR